MGLDKKSLDRIVKFVKAVKDVPGNEEFIAKLRKVLEIQAPTNVSAATIPNVDAIEKIEHYLGLDYSLDDTIPRIDYSFIAEDDIRNQLEADYREMLRYRYGLRAHKVDFMEFCRYVQLQAEMVLNYYYDNRFADDDEIKAHISEISWLKKIENINYFTLLVGFCCEHKLDHSILDDVRIIRNSQSHRSAIEMDIDKTIAIAQKFFSGDNFDKRKMVFRENKVDSHTAETFKSETGVDIKTYNLCVREHMLMKNQPYNDIIASLSKIVSIISQLM